jgi:hypothetical protein
VYFVATDPAATPRQSGSASSSGGSGGGSTIYRHIALSQCLEAAGHFFAHRLSIRADRQAHLPVGVAQQTHFVLSVAARLLWVEADGWRPDAAREQLNLPEIIDRYAGLLESARRAGGSRWRRFATETGTPAAVERTPPEDDVFSRQVRYALKIKEWFEGKLAGRMVSDFMGEEWAAPSIALSRPQGTEEKDTVWMAGLLGNSAWSFDGIE